MDIKEIKEKTEKIKETAAEILEAIEEYPETKYPIPPEKEKELKKDLGLEEEDE